MLNMLNSSISWFFIAYCLLAVPMVLISDGSSVHVADSGTIVVVMVLIYDGNSVHVADSSTVVVVTVLISDGSSVYGVHRRMKICFYNSRFFTAFDLNKCLKQIK